MQQQSKKNEKQACDTAKRGQERPLCQRLDSDTSIDEESPVESVCGDLLCDIEWAIPKRAQLVAKAFSGFWCQEKLAMYHDLVTDFQLKQFPVPVRKAGLKSLSCNHCILRDLQGFFSESSNQRMAELFSFLIISCTRID